MRSFPVADLRQFYFVEYGTVAGLTDTNWTNFAADQEYVTEYDAFGRVIEQQHKSPTSTTLYSLVNYSYDDAGRPECSALRMTFSTTASPIPSDACEPAAQGANGPDRITRNIYDEMDRVVEVRSGVGTSLEQVTQQVEYHAGGAVAAVVDAEGNRTEYSLEVGKFRRIEKVKYPSKTTPGQVANDYEQFYYDADGSLEHVRTRYGKEIYFTYDGLGRVESKSVVCRSGLAATHCRDVFYGYDHYGNLTYARFDSANGEGVSFDYDAFGRKTHETQEMDGNSRTLSVSYRSDGERATITHPDSQLFRYGYDSLSRLTWVSQSDYHQLRGINYSPNGRPTSQFVSSGTYMYEAFGYDAAGRVTSRGRTGPQAGQGLTIGYSYNPASQIIEKSRDNSAYVWNESVSATRTYDANGLNQYNSVTSTTGTTTNFSYDLAGNLYVAGNVHYLNDMENRLVYVTGGGYQATCPPSAPMAQNQGCKLRSVLASS